MKSELPAEVKKIMATFTKKGYEIYIVGGAVRDILMGKSVYDWDFTTNATPEEIVKVIPDGFYDNVFGTVGLKVEGFDRPFEITTYRTESGYSDKRRPDKVSWGKTLSEDLSRRDFTINALALDSNLKLIDEFDGKGDLEKKNIKTVGSPTDRFSEDALRMMRAVRIASELGFTIEDKTFEAIKKNSPLVGKIAKERVRDELLKLLASPFPYEGMVLFRNSALIEEVLPELEKCFGVEQKSPGRHHIYDVGTHLLMSLKACKNPDPIVRFAVLIHDIGKPQTFKKLPTGVITFYNHEMVSTRIATNIADRLRFSKKQKDKLVTLVRWHQFTVGEMQTDNAIRRFIRNVGVQNINDMLDLRISDRLGSGAKETSWRLEEFKKRIVEVQKQPFSISDLKIDGNDVMKELKIKPGPKVGQILGKLFSEVESKKTKNDKKSLLSRLSSL